MEQAAVANLRSFHQEFDYAFFDDADIHTFIDQEFPEYREVFDSFPFSIQRIDFFRYLAVYRLGGFYFDLDVLLARGVSDLTVFNCVFPFEELTLNDYLRSQHQMDWEVGNYAFGAAPGHPFLRAVIENCVRSQKEPTWVASMMASIPRLFRSGFEVLYTTGPGMVTRTLAENPRLADSIKIMFPLDVCDESTWHNFGDYGVHLMAASWRPRGNYLKRRLALRWESRMRRRHLVESRKLGPHRRHPGTAALSA